jgi:hypothetical protein
VSTVTFFYLPLPPGYQCCIPSYSPEKRPVVKYPLPP